MRTIIFILALTALACPVFTAAGDAAECNNPPPTGCNKCLEGTLTACYDCKAGYFLTWDSANKDTTGTCTRCTGGKAIAAGTATVPASKSGDRPASVTSCTLNCDATCAECFGTTPASCTKCAVGKFSTTALVAGVGATCGGTCQAGKTRDVAGTDLSTAEVETTVCVNCGAGCATCYGTGATKCTKCAAGTYAASLTAAASPAPATATCTACDDGTGRDAPASLPATQEVKATACTACHASCATCKGVTAGQCTKCAAFYYATAFASGTATCSLCPDGKTRTSASASVLADVEAATVCADNCNAGCAACKGTANTGCTKCPVGFYASAWDAAKGTATCSSACDAGTTRDVATAYLADNEVKGTVCVACNAACAACKGTAATGCTKCAVGHYLSAKAADANDFGTCTACTGGKGKGADAEAFKTDSKALTNDGACTATCTAASNCGSCSAAEVGKCLTCPADYKLDTTANTCTKAEAPKTASASLLQALCGASVAAYALF